MENNLYLRPANENDMELLFVWANDETVRINSFNTNPIKKEEHEKWFSKILKDDKTVQYILMDGTVPAGQIRYSLSDDMTEAEIGYSISKEFRNKGLGKKIVALGSEKLKEDVPSVKTVIARVKEGNTPSEKCFKDCGFMTDYKQFKKNI